MWEKCPGVLLYPQCIVSGNANQFVSMLVTLTLIPSNPVFFNQLISSSLLCLLICVGFFPHLLLSCSLSLLCSFSVFFFFYPGPFGLLTSGSVSLFISGPLWFPFLPAAASAPLDFGPVSPSSLPSTERCTRPLGPATRLTHS